MKKSILLIPVWLCVSIPLTLNAQWQSCNLSGYNYFPKSFIESSGTLNLNGNCISPDSGNTWSSTSSGFVAFSMAKNTAGLFAGSADAIYFSNTNGVSWTNVYNTGSNNFVYGITMLHDTLFAATRFWGILMSPDNGNTFNLVNAGLPNDSVYSILTKGNLLFAGIYGNGIYRSYDSGTSWVPVNNGIPPFSYVSSMTTDGTNIYALAGSSVFISGNDGANWTQVVISSEPVAKICVAGNTLLAGGFTMGGTGGVYRSNDQGMTWTVFNSGLPACNFGVGTLYATDSYVFCGMESQCGAVYRIPIDEIISSVVEENDITGFFSIYPNPCIDIVTIKASSMMSIREVRLSDVQGKILLRQNITESGSEIKMELFPAGIYFVSITDGNGKVHQMQLMKE